MSTGAGEHKLADGAVVLADGRKLGFARYGDAGGHPLLLFHGTPGSRLLCPDEALTAAHGVHLVSVDRPAYGNSDPHPGRWLSGWPNDIEQLADHLGLDRFSVIGWSGGGPHALACAALIAERVAGVGVVACSPPTDEMPGLRDDPQRQLVYDGALTDRAGTAEAVTAFFDAVDGNDGKRWVESVRENFPDDPVFANPGWSQNFADHVIEGFRNGGAGRGEDAVATYGPWGFALKDVAVPVLLFSGGRDALIPQERTDFLAESLPSAAATMWPDGTHAVLYTHWGDILDGVVAQSDARS